jgi:hypothetical protein
MKIVNPSLTIVTISYVPLAADCRAMKLNAKKIAQLSANP